MIFEFSVIDLINVLFIANGIGICALCIMQMASAIHIRKEVRRYFQIFFSTIILYIGAHLLREIFDGMPGSGVRVALYIITFVEMFAAGIMAHMMSMLVLVICKRQKSLKPFLIGLYVLLGIHLVFLIVFWPFDLLYSFNENNEYARGTLYLLSNLAPVAMLITDIVLLIVYRKNIASNVKIAFWIYMIAPVVAIIIQSFSAGIQYIIFATVAAAVYMFSVIIRDQNAKYEEQRNEKSRIETELTMASSIQADMLPNVYPAFPERPEFDIYASMDPAKEVGGDFYDFFLIDDDHLCLTIADVSGKGVPAALFMMASKIILANNALISKSPSATLTNANHAICGNNREDMFVTVWLGILELSTGKLTAANAGHEFPILRKPDGNFELFKDKHGFVVGGTDGIQYKEYEIQLEPGSKLFVYTDGIPEANNGNKELFGTDRLVASLNKDPSLPPKSLTEQVRRSVDEFVKEAEQFDDLTMLCLEYRGKTKN
ncbi:MAG: PP2C family protein-serine/threonine phosphatase [Bacilli bacterium]|nr:PP2C family protein-serine/threonine phosphatase [Bacilli bacterium]